VTEKSNSFFRQPELTLDQLPFLLEVGRVEGEDLVIENSFKSGSLRTGPVRIPVKRILDAGHPGLVAYVFKALLPQRPVLIPWVFSNRSLLKVADHLLRFKSGSPLTFYLYAHLIRYFSDWCGRSPDEIVADVMGENGYPDPEKVQVHQRALQDYVAHLQDRGLAPNRVANYVKAVKALYRASGARIDLPYSLPRRPVRRDRAPVQEELIKLIDVADLRGKVIVSMLALGGFRVGTLAKLQYRHVKRDFEAGITPIHIHVEAAITKGKYHDYDTFIGGEAARYLRLYLKSRAEGTLSRYLPPEELRDDSPLIRDERFREPRSIGEKQISQIVFRLMKKAGIISPGDPYKVKVHSLRKFFKTQLLALGVQPDYVDYMMGHTIDTYHDVQSKGIEFLRGIYAAANLTMEPRQKLTKLDQLKIFAQGLGLNPESVIMAGAFAEPHRFVVEPERVQAEALSRAITENLKSEVLQEILPILSQDSMLNVGGAARIQSHTATKTCQKTAKRRPWR